MVKQCPYCGKNIDCEQNVKFANHVRWCKSNPAYNKILENTVSKMHLHKQSVNTYEVICKICGNHYNVQCTSNDFAKERYRKTCSSACAKQLTALNTNIETKRLKLSISNRLFPIDPTTGKSIYTKACKHCGNEFSTTSKKTMYCSSLCRSFARYGDNRNAIKEYKKACSFIFSLNDYPDEFDFALIEEYGWYKAKNRGDNLYGVSRDHIYSRDEGYKNLVDPYIISHPANCRLMKHSDNASKHSKCDISIEKLVEKVFEWNKKYGIIENTIDYSFFDKMNIKFNSYGVLD